MADECQAQNTPTTDAPIEPRRWMTKREMMFRQYEDINELIGQGVPKLEIARRLGISAKTLHNRIHEYRGMDLKALHQEAVDMASRRVARKLGKITELAIDETILKKDRVAALSIVRDTGVLDAVRGATKRDESADGRIVIEWSGGPPPWAPAPILKAYGQKQVESAVPPQVIDANVQDAEIVPVDTNAENSKTGQ